MKKELLVLCTIGILLFGSLLPSVSSTFIQEDLDPLIDLNLTVDIHAIRALDTIDLFSKPDLYVELTVNGEEFKSPVWTNQEYIYDAWTITTDIPDNNEIVAITLELWDENEGSDTRCDLSAQENTQDDGYAIVLWYNVKTGLWYGDDYQIGDGSGYGRVCGTDDGSIYDDENDCELWFSLSQNDYDHDGLPYWIETQVYGTDPEMNNTGEDMDDDGCPIEWEHHWGFNPLLWEDHVTYDPDKDSITNVEEYLTEGFGSDPFRQDVFLELDYMEESPDGTSSVIPDESKELLKNPFHRRNIVFHIDSGIVDGGDIIPFDDNVNLDEVREIYDTYFMNNDEENWKRGVFHYGVFVYQCTPGGYGFSGDVSPYMGYMPGTNSFVISSEHIEKNDRWIPTKSLAYCYGSAIMHEMGHNFGRRWGDPFGCDAQLSKKPWQLMYWVYRNYKSIMNYRYTYKIFDYSDGSHGRRDSNDWEAIDLTYFEIP